MIGCSQPPQTDNSSNPTPDPQRPVNVDVATVTLDVPTTVTEYIGTTKPFQEVSIRSQVEGKLVSLNVDVGDRILSGELIASIDDSLQIASVNKAKADLLALESELAQAESKVNNARIQVEKIKVELRQAENDAARFIKLAQDGAISQKEAENYQTLAKIAQKNLKSDQEQITIEQKVVTALLARITAQKSVIAQEQQLQSYSRLFSPINGIVLAKMTEIGNLITPTTEIIKIGDFSQVKITVPVSELELGNLNLGQIAEVKFDAFPNQSFAAKLTTIDPIVDTNNRKVNLELTLDNPDNRIGTGLLARVKFNAQTKQKIIIPESALNQNQDVNYIFLIKNQQEEQALVEKQTVEIGNVINGKVEILNGLQVNEQFVVNSSQPLQNGDRVNLSVLSE
jgi:RND family efflux transporter MFP subunit